MLFDVVGGAGGCFADDDDCDLDVNLFASLDSQEVNVKQVALDRVTLNVLDKCELRRAVDLELNKSVLVTTNDQEQVVFGKVKVGGFAVAVNNARNRLRTASATCCALTELGAGGCDKDRVIAHKKCPPEY